MTTPHTYTTRAGIFTLALCTPENQELFNPLSQTSSRFLWSVDRGGAGV